jgi:S1-C subfamily serine protease
VRNIEPLPGQTREESALDRARRSVVSLLVEHPTGGDSFGAGIVYDERGHIITAHHVVENASRSVILLSGGFTSRAEIVASDPVADFAIIRMQHWRPGLAAAAQIDPVPPREGDDVWSIGNPFGTSRFSGEASVSRGIISATQRSYFNDETGRLYLGCIQHDAPTNPGNSGGGVFNAQGRLVGMNALITHGHDSSGDAGVAFALPAAGIARLADALLRGQTVVHGWLGAKSYRQATEILSHGFGRLRTVFGEIAQFGPAYEAGLCDGDVIISLGGRDLFGLHEVLSMEDALIPGQPIALTINRAGNELEVSIRPGQRPWHSP